MRNYIKQIEKAVQFGLPILMQNVSDQLDSILQLVIDKAIFKMNGVEDDQVFLVGVVCVRLRSAGRGNAKTEELTDENADTEFIKCVTTPPFSRSPVLVGRSSVISDGLISFHAFFSLLSEHFHFVAGIVAPSHSIGTHWETEITIRCSKYPLMSLNLTGTAFEAYTEKNTTTNESSGGEEAEEHIDLVWNKTEQDILQKHIYLKTTNRMFHFTIVSSFQTP
ncbi:hypothetical protein BLNAU_3500 [Blattamonas nauphoetae]|uniref:Dynein heavy chain ATP-binding dynein motor region domain-containing protein n=1 Tax=Blattamonas nauphoetae TaxID=2049346 RepID=A0ABQ9YCB6_9EUKA|nr:hypothetical protein BLNAU_3500 [Blattamonas nauphoetae]